jgi:hypothetical protein
MVVKRKPVNVEEFIQEGGSEAQIAASPMSVPSIVVNTLSRKASSPVVIPGSSTMLERSDEEVKGLKLRLSVELIAEIDAAVKRRRPSPSRHQWILEAIYEKLSREAPESNLNS